MMNKMIGSLLLTALSVLALTAPAEAVRTEFFRYERLEDYLDCSFRGIRMSDDGVWRLGEAWHEQLADEIPFFTEMGDDGEHLLLAGGGSPGKLILFDKDSGRHELLHSEQDLLYSCVETLGSGHWAVGTGPGGKVYEIRSGGSPTLLYDTGQDFVWDLCLQGEQLWIATGNSGEIYRFDVGAGRGELFYTVDDQSVFALACDARGRLLAGSSGEGRLYRFDEQGRVELLADFEAEEIQRILTAENGSIYLAVAEADEDCQENCSAVYRLEKSGLLEKMLSSDSAFVGDLLEHPEVGIWVASGDPAELDHLTDLFHGYILGMEEGVFFSDLHWDGEDLWLLQSKPSRLLRIGGRKREASLSSDILDLGSRSVAGLLRLEGELDKGGIEVKARSGHSEDPDTGWSEWLACKQEEKSDSARAYHLDLPAARYFQWRVTLKENRGVSPLVYRASLSFLPLNRTPLIGNLSLLRSVDPLYEASMELSGRPLTQVLERGVRVQYQQNNGLEIAADAGDNLLRGLRQIQWDWLDPDGDRMRARIEYRSVGEAGAWRLLAEDWTANIYTWDSRGLNDGRYVLRVTVDDGEDNPAGGARSMSLVSRPIRLDSRAPAFDLKVETKDGRVRVSGEITDEGGGVVERIEARLAVDGRGIWRPLVPAHGFLDRARTGIETELEQPEKPGLLELRARDDMGNWSYFRQAVAGRRSR